MKQKIRFGIIGCGLMGREFASAVSRWCHLNTDITMPDIVGVCDVNPPATKWFSHNFKGLKYVVSDYKALLDKKDIDAIYCAVPHNLQEQIYIDILKAGKHLLGEKPFGIDKKANDNIVREIKKHPELTVRCSSEFPFFPACQQLFDWINQNKFGRILEVKAGFNHSSDMDISKPINWKRQVRYNGEYGCMGDLGIHTQHLPFRAGWLPQKVYARLSSIVNQRYDKDGSKQDCDTFDNATLACEALDKDGHRFPITFEMKRMSPGSTNDWYIEVYGLNMSAKFSTNDPNSFYFTQSWGKEQAWARIVIGYKPLFPTITGEIFEFGFTDSILQMWAAFISEIEGDPPAFTCFTVDETRYSHALLTAALTSHKNSSVEKIVYND
jgi:predicted dehydrogenase